MARGGRRARSGGAGRARRGGDHADELAALLGIVAIRKIALAGVRVRLGALSRSDVSGEGVNQPSDGERTSSIQRGCTMASWEGRVLNSLNVSVVFVPAWTRCVTAEE